MLWPSCRNPVRRGGDDIQRGTHGIGSAVRKLRRDCWPRSPSVASRKLWRGVDAVGGSILLNASKLRIRMVFYASLGEDEAAAIVTLLRVSNNRLLTILEQARFIEESPAGLSAPNPGGICGWVRWPR